jgi:dTDP-4-dehydrorhamnose 3,5-epimerase-like enzyme
MESTPTKLKAARRIDKTSLIRGSGTVSPSTSMNEAKTNGHEPVLIPIACHVDDRGFLYQIFGDYVGEFPDVRRIYVVGNFARGVIRGYHMHKQETKGYFVVSGSAKFVAVKDDERKHTFVLTHRNPSVLLVPPQNYHGWVSLEDNTVLIGLSDRTLEQSVSDDYRTDPMKFGGDVWKVEPR